ncbi:MAG: hypothetical protein ABSH01_04705 [Terriglobia bacterium]|jgi:hypothetical protein
MSSSLIPALQNYLSLVQSLFAQERSRDATSSEESKRRQSLEDRIRSAADAAEQQSEFSELLEATAAAFSQDGKEKTDSRRWQWSVKDFLRLSGLYLDAWDVKPLELHVIANFYQQEFEKNDALETHLAPLEFVRFSEETMKFGEFEVRRFSREELDALLKNRIRQVFYPYAAVETAKLTGYWFVVSRENMPVPPRRGKGLTLTARLPREQSPLPRALERALLSLALCRWGLWTDRSWEPGGDIVTTKDVNPFAGRLHPRIPFFITASDVTTSRPTRAPDLSVLTFQPVIDPETGETTGDEPANGMWKDGEETKQFVARVTAGEELIGAVIDDSPEVWQFMNTALHFFVKAFLGPDNWESLLWYVTAIEALLGEEKPQLTKLLKKRVSLVIGTTETERKNVAQKFDKIYGIRSHLVHGKTKLGDFNVFHGHLGEVHEMARRIAIWMLHLLLSIRRSSGLGGELPSREDILAMLEMDESTRNQFSAILPSLPPGFPGVAAWKN